MTPHGLQIASPEDSLAGLGIVANRIVIVYIVFRICITDCRRMPVRIQGFTYLFLFHGLLQLLLASSSLALCDETGDACLHYFIEPLPGLNTIDFVKGVFRKGGYAEIFSRTGCSLRRGEHSRTTLDRPC